MERGLGARTSAYEKIRKAVNKNNKLTGITGDVVWNVLHSLYEKAYNAGYNNCVEDMRYDIKREMILERFN